MMYTEQVQGQAPVTNQHTTKQLDTRSHILRGNECNLIYQLTVLEGNKACQRY